MPYTHIIWDFDGTLYDTYPSMASAFAAVLGERGISEPVDDIYKAMKISVGHALDMYRARYENLDDAFLARYKDIRMADEQHAAHPFPGIPELLRRIVANGGHNYILTHRGPTTHTMLERDGLDDVFDGVITTEQNFPRKPDPAGLVYLIQTHDMPMNKAIMVGDRDLDILTGKHAGIATCFFDPGGVPSPIADQSALTMPELAAVLGYTTK